MKKNSMYDKYHRIELIHALILTINKISWIIYLTKKNLDALKIL
jgi:hypothetical protein